MTKKPETRLWALEFGYGYAVPEKIDELVARGALTDNSWHNDVAPSFIRRDGLNLWTLWTDHPEKDSREFPEHNYRYAVYHCLSKYSYPESMDGATTRYEGNDLDKALSAILNTNGTDPAPAVVRNDPEPDSKEWFESIARRIRTHVERNRIPRIIVDEVEAEFVGGGWVVTIELDDETVFKWGTANPEWGADVFFPWNEDGDIDDSLHIALSTEGCDLDEAALEIIEATGNYIAPPRPDSPPWFDMIALKVKERGGDRFSKVETYHSGGGIYGVAITRKDGGWLFWGTANETWGADAHPNYDSDSSGDVTTELSTETKDLDAVAAVIVSNTLQCDFSATSEERLKNAVDDACEAFWASVVKSYPESTSGDFGPHEDLVLTNAMKAAIRLWVSYNVPNVPQK